MEIVFIGDSLTQYFDWQRRFPEHTVMNLGIAGESVEELLARIDTISYTINRPDIIFVMTGINNVVMEEYDIAECYRKIMKRLSATFKNAELVVQSILPADLSWVDNKIIESINMSLKRIAHEVKAEYLDVTRLFINASGRPVCEYLLDDGVHVSDKGYELWSKIVESFIDHSRKRISSNLSRSSSE
ncbi:MAG: GDSL-type esterase/lipase family protein [Dissulfurispiraceae bacterium]